MLCDSLAWLHVQWCINLTHEHIDELRVVSTLVWMIGVHGTSHTNQGNSKKCASVLPSMLVQPWSVVWLVWILSPCLVACAMVYQPHPCTHKLIERGATTCVDGWRSVNNKASVSSVVCF